MAYFALVPAAGTGTRLGDARPKQYHLLAGRPMIHHALKTLCSASRIERVFVVLAGSDTEWDRLMPAADARVTVLRCGGATRAQSVGNGLAAIAGQVADDDWVLVHDAARPCLSAEQLSRLINIGGDEPVGAILACPVADTLKQADAGQRIAATVPRAGLWQAQTPQMFRHGLLSRALAACSEVTDEAGAVEALGLRPRLVAGDASNLKVTYAEDLRLAEAILMRRNAAYDA